MQTITTRLPVVEDGDAVVALVVGSPDADFGAEVTLVAEADRIRYESYYVAGTDSFKLNALPDEVLSLFRHKSWLDVHTTIQRAYKTGLPEHVDVTIYTLFDSPVEEFAGEEA